MLLFFIFVIVCVIKQGMYLLFSKQQLINKHKQGLKSSNFLEHWSRKCKQMQLYAESLGCKSLSLDV